MAAKPKDIIWDAPSPAAHDDVIWDAPAPKAPERGLMDTLGDYAAVGTRALAPYATAAGVGAAAGAPFGGVGAVPGAAGGVLTLGLGDLATSAYNLAAPVFGGQRVALPSETIQNQFTRMGVGRAPTTPGQQVFSDVLQAGAGGLGQAKAAQALAPVVTSPAARNVMQFLGQNARAQTGASVGGAAAPSVAANYFGVQDPYALTGLSLAGGLAGGKFAASKPTAPSAADLEARASNLYKQMESEGVNVASQAMSDLAAEARKRAAALKYDPDTDKLVTEALNLFDKKAGQPITYDMLEKFRRSIRDLPYSEAGGKRGTPEQRAVVKALDDTIDEFMGNLKPGQTTAGDAATAARYLSQARITRRQAYIADTVNSAVDSARTASVTGKRPPSYADALIDQFKKIATNPRKMAKLDPDTQAAVRDIAQGNRSTRALRMIGRFAPTKGLIGLETAAAFPSFAYAPKATAAGIGLQMGALGARSAANAMTKRAAEKAMLTAGGVAPGGPGYYVLSPTAQQAVQAQERGRTARNRMATVGR